MGKLGAADFRNLAIAAVATVLASLFYGQINYTIAPYVTQDNAWYLQMAEAVPYLDPSIIQPFAFRISGPFLVGLLPVSEPTGFLALTVVFSICATGLFYYLLRYAGVSSNTSLVMVALVLLNRYVFGILLWNYFRIPETLSFVFLIVLFLAMWKNSWLIFGITLALGAFTREITILMVPVAFIYLLEQKELSLRWRQVLAAVVPGMLVFVLLRVFVPIGGGKSLFEALAVYSSKLYNPESLFRGLINTFLPFTLVPLVYFRTTLEFFKARKHLLAYIVLVYLSTMLGENEERLIAPTFIVFFMLLGAILDNVKAKRWTFFVLLAAGFLTSFHHTVGIWLLPSNTWTRSISLGATVCVTLYMLFSKRMTRTEGDVAHVRPKTIT